MSRDFIGALLQLNAEKNIPREQLIRTVEEAIESAYRRVAPGNENVCVEVDPDTGKIRIFRAKTVVDEVEDPEVEFTLEDARAIKADARLGERVEIEQMDASSFGRIHAQTAKQVVLQRLREAEREQVFGQFAQREGEIITGTVGRVEPRAIILDVGRGVEAILATTEQSAMEHYRIGQHVKAYVLEVRRTTKGPQIFVSRTHKGFLRRLFELEVPEIHSGAVEIKAIAREAGSRSKVAVTSRQEGLDPVGATVGQRGGRVQAVVAELNGEKIDVIEWHEDPAVFVAKALSPAQVVSVDIDEEARIASVQVPERMLSLAIGREGQNARLAAKLTGWRIDIRSDTAPAKPAREAGPGEATEANGQGPQGSTDAPEVAAVAADAKAADEPAPAIDAPATATDTAATTADEATAEVTANTEDEKAAKPKAAAKSAKPKAAAKSATGTRKAAQAEVTADPATDAPKAPVKATRSTRATKAVEAASADVSTNGATDAATDGEQPSAAAETPKRRRGRAAVPEEVSS
ncbi:MAG TPA: transcription termination factor NusA [Candidatus Limnocylindrales bacterium]|nr:transcription termination factor NusA [Candidatus Limnocylindrales bacterium]